MIKITSSPCLVVNPQTTLRETIELMQRANSSYVLVENSRDEALGIFTDRDLLSHFFELTSEQLSCPVTSLMTSPVIMLPIHLLQKSAALMKEKNIRHVPIFETIGHSNRVIAMVTLRGLAQANLFNTLEGTQKDAPEVLRPNLKSIGVLSAAEGVFKSVQKLFDGELIPVHHLNPDEHQEEGALTQMLQSTDALIMDIDHIRLPQWKETLKCWNRLSQPHSVFVLLRRDRHPENTYDILTNIARSDRLSVFSKPVDLVQLSIDLRSLKS